MRLTQRVEGTPALAYDREGVGPLIVFLHGIGGNRTSWAGQLAHFGAKGFCAVSWDARGYGDSDDPPRTLRFGDYADDLARLLDHLRAERAHVAGLSMGGMIAQDFYGRYPERTATLALIDTSVGLGTASEAVRRDFLSRRLDPLERGRTPADIAPAVADVLVAKSASAAVRERVRGCLSALRAEPYKQALRAVVTTDFRAVLPRIAVPTLVLVGEEDIVTPPAESEVLVNNIPGAVRVTLPGVGHLTNVESPEAFNAALEAFLSPHARRAARVSGA